MRRLEALVDSIACLNSAHEPESLAYRLRNPLLLRAVEPEHLGNATDECIRIFTCHAGGYRAAFDRVKKECRWNGGMMLTELVAKHGHPHGAAQAANFICRALESQDVDEFTPIHYFLE